MPRTRPRHARATCRDLPGAPHRRAASACRRTAVAFTTGVYSSLLATPTPHRVRACVTASRVRSTSPCASHSPRPRAPLWRRTVRIGTTSVDPQGPTPKRASAARSRRSPCVKCDGRQSCWLRFWSSLCASRHGMARQLTRDTHRGRDSVSVARDPRGRAIGAGLTLRLKPTKTDRNGESGATRTFVVDKTESALPAAAAIVEMLRHDAVEGDQAQVPLFRDPKQGARSRMRAPLASWQRRCGARDTRR